MTGWSKQMRGTWLSRLSLGKGFSSRSTQWAAAIAVLMVGGSFVAGLFLPDPNAQDLVNRLQAPSWLGGAGGALGTDQLGRSVLSRIMAGVRSTTTVAIGAAAVGFVIGTTLGMIAGYFRGRIDSIIGAASDVQLSFPALLLAMVLIQVTGHGIIPLILILGLNSWMLYARMARSSTLALARVGFVEGARSLGLGHFAIIRRHIFHNVLHTVLAVATLEAASHMLAEVALSFLGFGLTPPQVSLGTVLADGRDFIATQWWMTTFAGLAISILVLSVNIVGRSMRAPDISVMQEMV